MHLCRNLQAFRLDFVHLCLTFKILLILMTIFHFQPCLQMGFYLQEAHKQLFLLPIYPLNTLNVYPGHTQGLNIKEFLQHHFLGT